MDFYKRFFRVSPPEKPPSLAPLQGSCRLAAASASDGPGAMRPARASLQGRRIVHAYGLPERRRRPAARSVAAPPSARAGARNGAAPATRSRERREEDARTEGVSRC